MNDLNDLVRARNALLMKNRPDLVRLRRKLLQYGGEEVVIPPDDGPFERALPKHLLQRGALIKGRRRLKPGKPCRCHDNSMRLVRRRYCDAWCTGYALSRDGLWRCHSWGLRRGEIIETTVVRQKYFGLTIPAAIITGRAAASSTTAS